MHGPTDSSVTNGLTALLPSTQQVTCAVLTPVAEQTARSLLSFFSLFLSVIDFFFLSFTLYLPIFIFVLLVACVGVMCLCMSV